ncbi:MAG: type 4a pilus biogenesis protein PilO [Deltaproteobacteria bacterium]|nr:type 4a pilus biogenesis protein PilO [Deltaproteobacteria bacterium]
MSFEAIEGIPKQQRVIVIVVLFVAVIGLFFLYPYRNNHRHIESLNKKIAELERQIVVNKSLAEKKDELLSRNAELQKRLHEVQQKFPTSSEVTDLLRQVSILGQQSGLDFRLWKPRAKVKSPSNLYYEIPVEIEVVGGYHEVGVFFDRVSKLPRIVNITDLSMSSRGSRSGHASGGIVTRCIAKTFSAMSEKEMQSAARGHRKK